MNHTSKPRLLFFRMAGQGLPVFVRLHLQEQVKCLAQFFDVIVMEGSCDYDRACAEHRPQLSLFESGVYTGPRTIANTSAHPQIPKLGFCHCDAYCVTREAFISDMAAWGVEHFFTLSVALAAYTPALADQLFVWPNFVDPETFHDFGLPKVIPVLFTGSQATHYPWRNGINRIISQHYPTLQSPHFGWFDAQATTRMATGQAYARLINATLFAPTCGTMAQEVVRKHFEIPACNCCLITQRTPALEAAGFVDQVNCLLADESDVLDKLDWLFQHPEERQRISQAGHDLVHARHTIHHRDQIYQWFRLHQQLKPQQRVIQPGPFLPLAIVDRDSGIKNGQVPGGALDRMLLKLGDQHLWAGRYHEAETAYYKCLNYHNMPEPKLGLVLCCLFTGKPNLAAELLWEQFQSLHIGHGITEPDPVEWAYYIVALLCAGKTREAVIRSGQFESLQHPELTRIRAAVAALFGPSRSSTPPAIQPADRYSVHQLPVRTLSAWLDDLRKMLTAGRQTQLAIRLANAALERALQTELETQRETAFPPALPVQPAMSKAIGLPGSPGISPWAEMPPEKKPVNRQVGLLRWIRHQGGRVKRRSFRLARAAKNRVWPTKTRPEENADLASLIRHLMNKEDIQSGLLIGADNGEANTEAFLAGLAGNPNHPVAACLNFSAAGFRKLQKRLAENARVHCRLVPRACPWVNHGDGRVDAMVINGSELPEDFLLAGPLEARFVVLDDINSAHIYRLCQLLLADRRYTLSAHDPWPNGGYAIFNKLPVRNLEFSAQRESLSPYPETGRQLFQRIKMPSESTTIGTGTMAH